MPKGEGRYSCEFWSEIDDAETGREWEWCDLAKCKTACWADVHVQCRATMPQVIARLGMLVKEVKALKDAHE